LVNDELKLMVAHKARLWAAILTVIVISAAAVGFAIVRHQLSQVIASNEPYNSTSGQTSPPISTPTTTSTKANQPTPSPSPQLPNPTLPPTNSVSNGLQLSISLPKTVFGIGEPVNVTLTITNVSAETVNFTSTGMNFDFLVFNATNNLVYEWSFGKAFPMFAFIEPLKPGENVTATYTWPQTFSNPESLLENLQVPSGTYYIVGKSSQSYGLETAPEKVTILSS